MLGGRVIILRQKLGITGTQLQRGCEQEQKKACRAALDRHARSRGSYHRFAKGPIPAPSRGLTAYAVLGLLARLEIQVRADGPVWYADWLGFEDTNERNHVIGSAFLLDRDINAVL